MTRTLTFGIAAIALISSTAAIAQNRSGGEDMTRAAAETRAGEMFAKMDVNGDGELNQADREAKRMERFAATDTDGNGELSYAEMTAAREAKKAKRSERREQRRAQRAQRGAEAGAQTEERRGSGERRAMRGKRGGERGDMGRRMMQRADTDQSGSVSQAEFMTAALTRFDRTDANSDGTVTTEERRAQRASMRSQMREKKRERRSANRAERATQG